MKTNRNKELPRQLGLSDLDTVKLEAVREQRLTEVSAQATGTVPVRHRKIHDARQFLALEQISGRFFIRWLDLAGELRAIIEMRVPVPCRAGADQPVRLRSAATIAFIFPDAAAYAPQPGTVFAAVLFPKAVFHPLVGGPNGEQVICLGPKIFGSASRIFALIYSAMAMQGATDSILDPRQPLGVMNPEAAMWFQSAASNGRIRVPLTNEPFIAPRAAEGAAL